MKAIDLAGDVRLFVLDDEGVLFSETRQELYSTNTAATLLWCLLEEGLSLPDVVDTYARTFGLTTTEAEAHVYPTLRRWSALGHISNLELTSSHDTGLTEALAFLLTNADLRSRFRSSPAVAAAALSIGPDALDAFLELDPDAVDRQADAIDRYHHQQRFLVPDDTLFLDAQDLLERAVGAVCAEPQRRRCYRLVGTTFSLILSAALDAIAHPVLDHLEVDA